MSDISTPVSRRKALAIAAAGGLLADVTRVDAQTEAMPEPKRGDRGGTNPGPRNPVRARQNPDLMSPPAADHGTLPNLRFSFDDAHVRLETGGWTRQVTQRELGVSKNIAGVNMRLNAGGVRELHWHKAAEWAYMLYGSARITAVDAEGRNFVDDVGVGDLWYFPSGIPHSTKALVPTALNFCSCLMTATSTRTIPSCSAIGSSTCLPTSSAKTSVCRRRSSAVFPIRANCTSFPPQYPVHSRPIRLTGRQKYRSGSAIACSPRRRSERKADRCASPTPKSSQRQRRSRRRW
jgi:uncharacterized RmlC-like cupin family protein